MSVLSTTLVLLVLEGGSSVLMSARAAKGTLYMREETHARYDADLGWSNIPGLHIDGLYGAGTTFSTNRQGFRANEEYGERVPAGRYRVICVGDSFTMGYGVSDGETYAARMAAQCPLLQTVNMGQGGYGVDQAYLWYKRDGTRLDANLVVFAAIGYDFYRMGSDSFIGYPKPILRVRDGALAVENVPVPRRWALRTPMRRGLAFLEGLGLVRTARWITRRVAPPPEEFHGALPEGVLSAAGLALDDLATRAHARGSAFALVYLPSGALLPEEPTPEATWLEAYARRKGVPFVSLVPDFGRLAPWELGKLFRPDYHYSVEGNRFVAATLMKRLREVVPGFPDCGEEGAGDRRATP
jgi:hypothetical protein